MGSIITAAVQPDDVYRVQVTFPEPATLSLLGLGLAFIGFMRRRTLG